MSKTCQMLSTSQYNHFRKTFRGYVVCKKWLLSAKGSKIAVEQHKWSLGGPKSVNQLYFRKYASLMSKTCQMLSTSQYNHFRKTFRGYGVCKKWLLSIKGAKIAVEQHKGSLRGSKIRKSAIFQKICLSDVQNLSNVEYQLVQSLQKNFQGLWSL